MAGGPNLKLHVLQCIGRGDRTSREIYLYHRYCIVSMLELDCAPACDLHETRMRHACAAPKYGMRVSHARACTRTKCVCSIKRVRSHARAQSITSIDTIQYLWYKCISLLVRSPRPMHFNTCSFKFRLPAMRFNCHTSTRVVHLKQERLVEEGISD